MDNEKKPTLLVPPQLPPFLANIFQLKPILGTPSGEPVKLVHEAIRALGSLLHTPELKDTGLSIELSQHLFDIPMVCHRQKYPITILSNEVVYDPPNLPNYIPVELKPVIGYPSNAEVSSVHTAFRISESFANVPSIFDPYLHSQLSQHLFDIQLARHVQRSIIKHFTPIPVVSEGSAPHKVTTGDNDGGYYLGAQAQEATEDTELQIPTAERVDLHDKGIRNPELGESGNLCRTNKLMTEIRDTLKNMNRVLIASQNSLARGLNSSAWHECGYDLGAHTLVNENGELPEAHNLPSFQQERSYTRSFLPARALTEDALAQYLRFYNMGEEVLEEGQLLKIKPGMIEDAKTSWLNMLARGGDRMLKNTIAWHSNWP